MERERVYVREGKGGKEGGREGGKEGGREGGREGGKEGGREGSRQEGREVHSNYTGCHGAATCPAYQVEWCDDAVDAGHTHCTQRTQRHLQSLWEGATSAESARTGLAIAVVPRP